MSSNELIIPQPLIVAVNAILPLVEQYRVIPHAEIEARLGSIDPTTGVWVSGVSDVAFNEILTMFLNYDGWDLSTAWTDMHDYMYASGSTNVRTSVNLNTSLQLTHITKQRIGMVELQMRNLGRVRVSLSTETPVCSKTLPETVTPHMVRIKKRRSFYRSPWRFDLTRVWRGSSRSEAERAQSRGEDSFEVEIEFVPDAEYWESAKHTSTYVATSLLMKTVDVLSDEMIGCEVVHRV